MSAPPAEAPGYRAALRVIKALQSSAPGGEVQALARGASTPPASRARLPRYRRGWPLTRGEETNL